MKLIKCKESRKFGKPLRPNVQRRSFWTMRFLSMSNEFPSSWTLRSDPSAIFTNRKPKSSMPTTVAWPRKSPSSCSSTSWLLKADNESAFQSALTILFYQSTCAPVQPATVVSREEVVQALLLNQLKQRLDRAHCARNHLLRAQRDVTSLALRLLEAQHVTDAGGWHRVVDIHSDTCSNHLALWRDANIY